MLFLKAKVVLADEKFQQVKSGLETVLAGNSRDHLRKKFMKFNLFGSYWSSDCLNHFWVIFK